MLSMAEAKPPDDSTETVLLAPQRTPSSGGAPGVAAIGAYRVERRLGQGGMGEVFLAWDDRLNRRVAIKRIRQDSPSIPNLHQRILQEARAAAGLSHPAIVQVHDLVEDASGAAIVMEYVEGATLAERLADGLPELPEALRLAREIAEGLAAAHAAGIVHRDLKAGNVIVTPSGHAKILDFGLARVLSGNPDQTLTQQGVVIGTYHAMSPEQASGRPVDARSDLFSFGVLLYEMLTGRSPFRGENVLETLKRLATEEPPAVARIRPDVPARLSDLVERLLEKDPADRPGNASEVAAALAEIEAPAPPRSRRPPNRVAAAALLVAIAALSGTAWVLLHPPHEDLPSLTARDEDYAALLEVKRRLDSGKAQLKPELQRVEAILRTSPRFVAARLQAASLSQMLFESTREVSYRDRALAHVREARRLAPGDPRPLLRLFRIELDGDHPEVAQETLARIEELLPGDPQVHPLRAELAQRLGRTEEALAGWRAAVETVPSWKNLYGLASLEVETGRIEEARRHFERILEISPGNLWALEGLAQLELLYGDLARAERLYLEHIARAPSQRTFFTNLGVTRTLLGDHQGAIEAYEQALLLEPDHVYATLNLAGSKLVVGQTGQARALYRKVLRQVEENQPPGGLSPGDSMVQAECLARLGQTRQAVEITRKTLARSPDDPEILHSAALVFSLAGDLASARVCARKALQKGMQPRFFGLAVFAGLRDDPELKPLLTAPPRQGSSPRKEARDRARD
jgi:serine/threonine protein kinase/Flp pilus assembly protein TadD